MIVKGVRRKHPCPKCGCGSGDYQSSIRMQKCRKCKHLFKIFNGSDTVTMMNIRGVGRQSKKKCVERYYARENGTEDPIVLYDVDTAIDVAGIARLSV